jgi:hypothetical protein
MGKMLRMLANLYGDGMKALSILAPLLSITFTLAKMLDLVSALRSIDYAWALLPITTWLFVAYVRRWQATDEQLEAPRPPAMSLATMHITEIAEYVLDHSAWGGRKRGELNLRSMVLELVPAEMRRAGKDCHVRLCVQRRLACSAGDKPAGAKVRAP